MCGFAGFLNERVQLDVGSAERLAARMALALEHRGPDDVGSWAEPSVGIGLGFRRLAIQDLSLAGHQPMFSSSRRFTITFNGEIYNHLELRAALEKDGVAPRWRGHSDTETLLAAFEHWGIDRTLPKLTGMFAFALWDSADRSLHLARDRFGEKPLYYGWCGTPGSQTLVFGSELKALRAHPDFSNEVSRTALGQYLRVAYVPAPLSIYEDIYKLEPGCVLTIPSSAANRIPDQLLRPEGGATGPLVMKRWWSLASTVESGQNNLLETDAQAIEALESTLSDAVEGQTLADVPVGAFLSGGVDSSTIVALMQKSSKRPVKTFTIGFEETGFDESPHALAVAQHLGTDHTEAFVTARDAQAVIPELPAIYDEPFADSSQIPTHLVCRAARQHVTVALSGDGGDEMLGGYNRYRWGPKAWSQVGWMPAPARSGVATAIERISAARWDSMSGVLNALLPASKGVVQLGNKAHKAARALRGASSLSGLYAGLVSQWPDAASLVRPAEQSKAQTLPLLLGDPAPARLEAAHRMMYDDSLTYLPDDILCKVDRAAMATSLETRVPFLDHRVVSLAWRLPLHMKIRNGQGKWLLRQVLYRHVPRELIERPKAGFAIPLAQWLRGPLREWAEALLDEARLKREGYFDVAPIRSRWLEHLDGADHVGSLWTILMFQTWLESTAATPQTRHPEDAVDQVRT